MSNQTVAPTGHNSQKDTTPATAFGRKSVIPSLFSGQRANIGQQWKSRPLFDEPELK
jgi:hypothetical protein